MDCCGKHRQVDQPNQTTREVVTQSSCTAPELVAPSTAANMVPCRMTATVKIKGTASAGCTEHGREHRRLF